MNRAKNTMEGSTSVFDKIFQIKFIIDNISLFWKIEQVLWGTVLRWWIKDEFIKEINFSFCFYTICFFVQLLVVSQKFYFFVINKALLKKYCINIFHCCLHMFMQLTFFAVQRAWPNLAIIFSAHSRRDFQISLRVNIYIYIIFSV